MKAFILVMSFCFASIICLGQVSKEQAFANTVKEVITFLSKRDSVHLSKFIDKKTGLYIIYRLGTNDSYIFLKTAGFSDTTGPKAPFYDAVRYRPLQYSKVPIYNCEKWTKTGLFTDTTSTDHLLSKTAKAENTSRGQQKTSKQNIFLLYNLELKSRGVVLADKNGNDLIFYLSYINNNWYLTIIDKATTDCSV